MNSKCMTLLLSALFAGLMVLPAEAAKKKPASSKTAKPVPAAEMLVDDFERADWKSHQAEGATIKLNTAPGLTKKGLRVAYDLKDTKAWVQISKNFDIPSIRDKAVELWLKGEGMANTLEIKLVDEDGTNFGVKKPAATNPADWTRLAFNDDDFEYWWGGDPQLGPIKEIYLAISAGEGGAGTVFLDDLGLVPSQAAALPAEGVIFNGESIEGWTATQAEGAKLTLGTAPGQGGNALVLDYSIPANQWVAIRRKIRYAFTPNQNFIFRVKGQGDVNNLELKIVDKDDSAFGKVVSSFKGDWQELRVPLSEFKPLWGKNTQLDPARIIYLDVAISGPGGKGQILIDEIQVVQSKHFFPSSPRTRGSRLRARVRVTRTKSLDSR